MKDTIVLKYNYSYVISGNNYQTAERQYYQFLEEGKEPRPFALGYVPTDVTVKVTKFGKDEICCEHTFVAYTKPFTFAKDMEVFTNKFTLKRGQAFESKCCETYWIYARGGENGPAVLRVEWIDQEQFMDECQKEAQSSETKAEHFAQYLLSLKEYDRAFQMFCSLSSPCPGLALCYEKGYGTKQDLQKALELYVGMNSRRAEEGIERILNSFSEKRIAYDNVKKTLLLERLGKIKEAYSTAVIPTKMGDNSLEDMRHNVELNIVYFLSLGWPHNDPSYSHTHNVHHLAEYYDMINGVPESERPVYWKTWAEDDPYESGTITKELFDYTAILNTIRAEANKGDVLALGVLIVQFHRDHRVTDHAELAEKLLAIAEKYRRGESNLAFYLLGLYHRTLAKEHFEFYEYDCTEGHVLDYNGTDIEADIMAYANKYAFEPNSLLSRLRTKRAMIRGDSGRQREYHDVCNYITYLYNKTKAEHSPLHQYHHNKAVEYFEIAERYAFHLAIAPLAKDIVEKYPETALHRLSLHEQYVPYIRYFTDDYYRALKKLRGESNQ